MRQRSLTLVLPSLIAAVLLFAAAGRAGGAPARAMENRFLFILETSSSMASRTNGIDEAIVGLLQSDIHGELRPNDTIGLWTYSDRVRTDFPKQVWSENSKDSIIGDVVNYLRHLHYEKRGRLNKVLPSLQQVIYGSERLTVIFVYDGAEQIHGTQFDADIKDLQKRYAREFRDNHQPLVTVLAARNGEVADYTINYPNAISVPHMADPLPEPVTNAPIVAAAPPLVVAPVQKPAPKGPHRHIEIIMSGRTNLAQSPAPPIAAPTPLPAIVPPTTLTNTPPAAPGVVQQPSPRETNASAVVTNIPAAPAMASPKAAVPPPVIAVAPLPPPPTVMPPPRAHTLQLELFIIAVSLLTIAIALVVFLVRRSRRDKPGVISPSTDRPR